MARPGHIPATQYPTQGDFSFLFLVRTLDLLRTPCLRGLGADFPPAQNVVGLQLRSARAIACQARANVNFDVGGCYQQIPSYAGLPSGRRSLSRLTRSMIF